MTSPTVTGNPIVGPQQIHVDDTDAGNVLLTFVSPNQRLVEKRELPPAAALRLLAEVSRVLQDLSAASDRPSSMTK